MRQEIAQFLQTGQEAIARIRVRIEFIEIIPAFTSFFFPNVNMTVTRNLVAATLSTFQLCDGDRQILAFT